MILEVFPNLNDSVMSVKMCCFPGASMVGMTVASFSSLMWPMLHWCSCCQRGRELVTGAGERGGSVLGTHFSSLLSALCPDPGFTVTLNVHSYQTEPLTCGVCFSEVNSGSGQRLQLLKYSKESVCREGVGDPLGSSQTRILSTASIAQATLL